jgi:hypothetical protein
MASESDITKTIPAGALRPYASFLILQCIEQNKEDALGELLKFMRQHNTDRSGVSWSVVATGIDGIANLPRIGQIDQIDGIVYQRQGVPSWAKPNSDYHDVTYSLALALRIDNLIAVHCDPSLRDALQRWLDRTPKLPLSRVPPEVLQGAFLTGEARGLWLRGTHSRRSTKADSKTLSGRKLQDALNPFEDSSFAMSTARAALPSDPSRLALAGNIGTTPRRALVWNKPTSDFDDFLTIAIEELSLVSETMAAGALLDRPYPILANESNDLSTVFGAYDVAVLTSDDLLGVSTSEGLIAAAETLQRAVFSVQGRPDSADFILDVGLDGSFGGALRVAVSADHGRVQFTIGFDNESTITNLPAVREVKDALDYSEDLLSVYYDSGHMVDGRSIWTREVRTIPYPRWRFEDFTGFDITKEKPTGRSPEDIHSAIGLNGDNSLFRWVTKFYSEGWLTCDDGPGEVADFVHVSPGGRLSLVHVKAAKSTTSQRRVAVGSYEVLASQAAKNLVNLNPISLRARLSSSAGMKRASWTNGMRMTDRSDFLDALDSRDAGDEFRVVIVQPHVSQLMYESLRSLVNRSDASEDCYRLNLLETLLNTIRGSVTSVGADMDVIASKV